MIHILIVWLIICGIGWLILGPICIVVAIVERRKARDRPLPAPGCVASYWRAEAADARR